MRPEQVAELRPGDRAWSWFDTGAGKTGGSVPSPFTIVKVCPKTVRARNDWGEEFYVRHEDIDGLVDWEED